MERPFLKLSTDINSGFVGILYFVKNDFYGT